jgi:hypothetical protein
MYQIAILDKIWNIEFKDEKDDIELKDADGYTSTRNGERRIVVKNDCYSNKQHVLRHELIHAFLFETGLGFCSNWATNEEMVDYFARNWEKINNLMDKTIKRILD